MKQTPSHRKGAMGFLGFRKGADLQKVTDYHETEQYLQDIATESQKQRLTFIGQNGITYVYKRLHILVIFPKSVSTDIYRAALL